jgi:hypothetical protein
MATAPDGGRYLAESYKDRPPKADIGRSCVRFKRPDDLDEDALKQLIRAGVGFSPIGEAGQT